MKTATFCNKRRLFKKKTAPFYIYKKKYVAPNYNYFYYYKKLQPQVSVLIKNSIFGNNKSNRYSGNAQMESALTRMGLPLGERSKVKSWRNVEKFHIFLTRQTDQAGQCDQSGQTDQTEQTNIPTCQTCKIANLQFRWVSEGSLQNKFSVKVGNLAQGGGGSPKVTWPNSP